ncbi:MAG: TIGR01548 family HAD-type hydrolase [Acidobacteria bacterium]|nr:TIGR01548 family HAD-type hydrolase [Acidobacteriota bacterium]
MAQGNLLIFDLDGVLVDVTESYRRTIIETVKHFTGVGISNQEIQAAKNRGRANNDWDLTLELARQKGASPTREQVIEVFQRIYLGNNNDGLIARERWLPRNGLLRRLSQRFRLALFTGRERWEAQFTLSKFAPDVVFDPIIGMEDVQREKPDPEGLLKIVQAVTSQQVFYVGDAVDDCRASRAAGVPFIGVVGTGNPLREELARLFQQEGAQVVIADVNELERALP